MKKFFSIMLLVTMIWVGIGNDVGIASENEKVPQPLSSIKVDKF